MTVAGDLHELVEAIARRVVELLSEEELRPAGTLLTVAEVAKMLGRSPDYVRDHRQELGVLPATGTRPRLHFDPRRVRAVVSAPEPVMTSTAAEPTRARPRRGRAETELLPIRKEPR